MADGGRVGGEWSLKLTKVSLLSYGNAETLVKQADKAIWKENVSLAIDFS